MTALRCVLSGVASALVAGALSLAAPQPAAAQDRPIVLGGNDEFDACNSAGVVSGLDPRGDGFLSLRGGPGTQYREPRRLPAGARLIICHDQGEWLAVVVPTGSGGCGVTTPWPRRRAYSGPCPSGWVHRRWVTVTAG